VALGAVDLETDRLRLRALRPADAPDVFVFRSDPVVQRYNSEPLTLIDEARTFLDEMAAEFDRSVAVHWGIVEKPADRVIGIVSLGAINNYHRRAELGYDLAQSHWGRGLGREAAAAIVTHAFASMHLNRVEAHTILDNDRSVRLLEALRFKQEAVLRAYSLEDDGLFHDGSIWSMLATEHRPVARFSQP
jgi:ribosomal-protein-alanine N-acetyltransferase